MAGGYLENADNHMDEIDAVWTTGNTESDITRSDDVWKQIALGKYQ